MAIRGYIGQQRGVARGTEWPREQRLSELESQTVEAQKGTQLIGSTHNKHKEHIPVVFL
jgi:hypothetical protein